MASADDLFLAFSKAIYAKVCALKQLQLTPRQQARLREAVSDDIKKCTNFVAPEVSRGALEEAAQLGLNLSTKDWHDQPRFDKGRKKFHFEHIVPVGAIRNLCLAESSESGVLRVLKTRLRVAWILKAEDAELTRLGYRSKRPEPEAAYHNAKIELVQLRTTGNEYRVTDSVTSMESTFNESFSNWEIRLPPDAEHQRKRGKIAQSGWAISYLFGSDETGVYLEYYASHRMTNDRHVRIHADGSTTHLPAIRGYRICSDNPDENARLEAEFSAENDRVRRFLEESGFCSDEMS